MGGSSHCAALGGGTPTVRLDAPAPSDYLAPMRPLARLFLTFLALTFAAGAFAQATAAARMDMPMAMSSPAAEHMPNCDDCGDPDEGFACFLACTLPALDIVAPEAAFRPLVKRPVQPLAGPAIIGTSRPPDPYPPRPPVLT